MPIEFKDSIDVVGKISLNDGGNSVFVGDNAGVNDDGTNNNNVTITHTIAHINSFIFIFFKIFFIIFTFLARKSF